MNRKLYNLHFISIFFFIFSVSVSLSLSHFSKSEEKISFPFIVPSKSVRKKSARIETNVKSRDDYQFCLVRAKCLECGANIKMPLFVTMCMKCKRKQLKIASARTM